jgi:hypothetical protein
VIYHREHQAQCCGAAPLNFGVRHPMTQSRLLTLWAILGAPIAILVSGYLLELSYMVFPNYWAMEALGLILPGACIGTGAASLVATLKTGIGAKAVMVAAYGILMYADGMVFGTPVLPAFHVVGHVAVGIR